MTTYTNAKFTGAGNIDVLIDGKQAFVPDDMNNLNRKEMADQNIQIAPYVPPTIDAIDQVELNRALAEPGSVTRALALLTLQEINKLRANAGLAQYTMQQFVTALKAQMR